MKYNSLSPQKKNTVGSYMQLGGKPKKVGFNDNLDLSASLSEQSSPAISAGSNKSKGEKERKIKKRKSKRNLKKV
jgi:hypothetical protein